MRKELSLPVYLYHQGTNYKAYELMGCHSGKRSNKKGYYFRVWAPSAQAVSLVGDFNGWDATADPMKKINDEGIWEIFTDKAAEGDKYKYRITGCYGQELMKADPYARFSENRKATASIVYTEKKFKWTDGEWMKKRKSAQPEKEAVNIYEVHAGSWKKHYDGREYNYEELADSLAGYLEEMNYTHVEFMPLTEYPYDGSWGYQVTGYFSPTSRYGRPEQLKYLVNKLHEKGIGVFLDWVPSHFCKDAHGLMEFDGKPLYENPIKDRMEHKAWGTRIFDYARNEVSAFLISSAIYWLNEFHFDGLRVDAVASMLYHDYDRRPGEWTPNIYGGKENLESIAFLKKLSEAVKRYTEGGLLIAEESTAFPGVTKPASEGLGFDFKWNMGWMNDVLEYMKTDPYFRSYKHDKMTFGMMYAYSEKYILSFSHDEVVHLKKSILDKMPGNYESKFAGVRTLMGFMMAHPGKKMNFMGYEIGQFCEWNFERELDWFLLDYDMHTKLQKYMKDLNRFYREHPQMYERDTDWTGFEWLCVDDNYNNVLIFERKNGGNESVIAVCNFANVTHLNYCVAVDKGEFTLAFGSDDIMYGGSGVEVVRKPKAEDVPFKNKPATLILTIPANSVTYYLRKAEDK